MRTTSENRQKREPSFLWALICLLLVEIITFGVNVKNIGVYQDEWITFGKLHFVAHSLLNLISTVLFDPKAIVRPLEALHFGTLFFSQWEKPLWYHIICYLSEFLTGWFLFLLVDKLSHNRAMALAAAVLFLLYPTHDVTHYSIVSSSLSISMALFTLSLWLFLKGIDNGHYHLVLWSAFAYFLSLFNYELSLPLVVLYPLLSMQTPQPDQRTPKNFKTFASYQTPFILVFLSVIIYRSWLLPHLGLGWHYATCYNLSKFLAVICAGLNASLSPSMLSFCTSIVADALSDGLPLLSWFYLVVAVGSVFVCTFKYDAVLTSNSKNLAVILVGLTALLFSYTIYGFSTEHLPAIDTCLNRVNTAGSLGACLIIAGSLTALRDSIRCIDHWFKRVIFASVLSILAGFLILINWQLAKPWVISWYAQKELMSMIRHHASEISSGDSIVIGGITRYTSKEVPVVDGVWDIQNIVRTTLNNQNIGATVVTERLRINGEVLEDRLGTMLLGTFPFEHMTLYNPAKSKWLKISTRKEFIERAKEFGWNVNGS